MGIHGLLSAIELYAAIQLADSVVTTHSNTIRVDGNGELLLMRRYDRADNLFFFMDWLQTHNWFDEYKGFGVLRWTSATPPVKTASLVGGVLTINTTLALDPEYDDWLTSLDTEYNYYEILAGQRLSKYQDLYEAQVATIRAGGVL